MTLDAVLMIPPHVRFAIVEQEAVLLDTRANTYYALDEAGARLWSLLAEGKSLPESCQVLMSEYEVGFAQLEKDVLELLEDLESKSLVEII